MFNCMQDLMDELQRLENRYNPEDDYRENVPTVNYADEQIILVLKKLILIVDSLKQNIQIDKKE